MGACCASQAAIPVDGPTAPVKAAELERKLKASAPTAAPITALETEKAVGALSEKAAAAAADKAEEQKSPAVQLNTLLAELETLVELEKVVEARKVVEEIESVREKLGTNDAALEQLKAKEAMIAAVVEESDLVEELLLAMSSDDGWTKSAVKQGVTVHYRHDKGSPFHKIRTSCVFDNFKPTDFVKLCSLFAEAQLIPKWFPQQVMKSNAEIAAPKLYTRVCHMKFGFGLLVPLSPRDAVVEAHGYILPEHNAMMINVKSVDTCRYCSVPEPAKNTVRVETTAAYFVQILGNNRILFKQIEQTDLKLTFLPTSILNFLARGGMPFEVVKQLRKYLKKYEGSEWDLRVKGAKREYYQGIEERILTELELPAAGTPQPQGQGSNVVGPGA